VKKILLIEENQDLLADMATFLELEGFLVISATDGLMGWQIAQECQPELIISELKLPKLDGYQFLVKLRKTPQTAKIPLIFITGWGETENRFQAIALGANDYLIKPVEITKIIDAIALQFQHLELNKSTLRLSAI